MKLLRAKLKEKELEEQSNSETALRRSQVGSGDRSEKIRTYNFPQSRVTDHRINLTLHSLDAVLNGELNEIIEALLQAERLEKLKDLS
jgi:peptide chain release factor 1